MDKKLYHSTLKAMSDAGVSEAYYHGWASGALGNPPLEEQRVTDDYTAGYEHAKNGEVESFKEFVVAKTK
ncbi:MAG: hypothetical protein V3U65_05510 [Granulosicoccaceae bacterium]